MLNEKPVKLSIIKSQKKEWKMSKAKQIKTETKETELRREAGVCARGKKIKC